MHLSLSLASYALIFNPPPHTLHTCTCTYIQIASLEDQIATHGDDVARLEDLLIKQQMAYKEAQARIAQLEGELAAYGVAVPTSQPPMPVAKEDSQAQVPLQTQPSREDLSAPPLAAASAVAAPPAPVAMPSDNGMVTYSISLETQRPNMAFTSSPEVTLQIFGVEGGMEPEIDPTVVSLGSTFVFDCTTEPLGQLAAVRMWHNFAEDGLTFRVERVVVFNRNTGEQTVFDVHQDVQRGEDYAVMVTLGDIAME